jgi:hypothetical protein
MVTIAMPAFNERDIIGKTVRGPHDRVIAKLPGAVLERLAAALPAVRFAHTPHNGGHGKALLFQTDSGQQHLPSEFWKLWRFRVNDFVFGGRTAGCAR